MGNFCTQCGRPLQEGEVCNCTAQAAPNPAPTPVQAAPSQSSREIKQGFENLVTALKTIWKNPAEAVSALAKKRAGLPH